MGDIANIRQASGVVDTALFIVDLPDVGGMAKLHHNGVKTSAPLSFAGG
ncbi:MAG: hypothetical protein V3V15_06360 [Sphingorhabdus sp.]